MDKSETTMAQQVGLAASEFHQQGTGHTPQSTTVVLGGDTLVVTLLEALSPAEKILSKSSTGAEHVQEFHRQLFKSSSDSLRREIKRIIGRDVLEAAAEVDPAAGSVLQVFSNGTVVQVFLLAAIVPTATPSGNGPGDQL